MRIWTEAIQATRRIRLLLVFVALLYACSYVAGWYLISIQSPIAVGTAQSIRNSVLTQQPFTIIVGALKGGELVQAILFTFLVNLSSGAFLTTTLPGIAPLLGAFAIVGITLLRGFAIGVTYPQVLASSVGGFALGIGTMVLELGAYVFSGAAGINIAIAPLIPRRFGVQTRWGAFRMAWKDAARIYVIIVTLLVLGAIWEMTGIFLSMR